jgi:electron transfer flavoprotein alpha subunit
VDEIITVQVAARDFDPDTFEAVTHALIQARKPSLVLVPHSIDAFGYAAALAAKNRYGFATDVFRFEYQQDQCSPPAAATVRRSMSRWIFPARSGVAGGSRQHLQAARGAGDRLRYRALPRRPCVRACAAVSSSNSPRAMTST